MVILQLHKAPPKSAHFLSAVMPIQRFLADGFPHLFGWYIMLRPLKDQCPVRLKNPHTFPETIMEHLRPGFIQFPILFNQPLCFFCFCQMRRIKDHMVKAAVWKRQIDKRADHIWVNFQCSFAIVFAPNSCQALFSDIAVHGCRVVLIKPNRPAPAGNV